MWSQQTHEHGAYQEILGDNGLTWLVDRPLLPVVGEARWARMRAMVERRNAEHALWGFKDPRTCLFMMPWKYLLPDAKVLLVVGTGALAPYMAAAHCALRPMERVLVWGRSIEHARTTAARLAAEGLPAEACADLAAGLAGADLVTCATTAREPIVRGSAQPALSAASRAFHAAIRALSRRFIWPAPTPAVAPSLA